jgi:NAD(P)-dependent dehydrogenase (short-subunit alcohol dehydrogenase family)
MSKVVLITGCSTGLGRDLAQRLAQAGYQVVATARNVERLDGIEVALKLPLDVACPESVSQAVAGVLERFGRIDVLVNNAGYALRGVVEEVSDEQVQRLFDVNVHGVLRAIRAVVPHMRRQKSGRIINISSIAGKRAVPVNGPYCAAKFALEALSDALRLELAPFGIQVVLIEPGSLRTGFAQAAQARGAALVPNPASPYHALYEQDQAVAASMSRNAPGPEAVSQVIRTAIEAARPKARYLVAVPLSGRLVLHLGDGAWDAVLRQMYHIAAPG